MSEHTKGPWATKPTASLGPQYAVYPEADGPDIAIVYDHGNTAANAQLIAAAPDLLEACNAVLAWLNSFSMPPTSTIDEKQHTMKIIETAIAKASGQNQ